ncbi:MAG: 16S rRNA processing protein RimM [Alphaproteobacteria bacterium]|nr:16S rRNA processing protein RimM [Alphaproteobacteria bacterium]
MTDLVCLGKIVAAHGIKGEVKLKSFTAAAKDVLRYGMLSNKDETRCFELVFKGFLKGLLRVQIKGVDTRNDAESLVGTELYVRRDKLPDLQEDVFYQTDLIQADVLDDKTLQKIGKVVGVYNFGAGDMLEIKFDDVKQTEMLPFNDSYVSDVDIKNKTVTLAMKTMNYQKDEESSDA